jgi:hypothetical protein
LNQDEKSGVKEREREREEGRMKTLVRINVTVRIE